MSSWKKRSSPIVLQRILWPSGHPWEQPACADPRWFLCFGIRGGKSAMISPEHAILLMALGHGHPWTQPPNVMCGSVTWMVIRRMGGQNIIYIYMALVWTEGVWMNWPTAKWPANCSDILTQTNRSQETHMSQLDRKLPRWSLEA